MKLLFRCLFYILFSPLIFTLAFIATIIWSFSPTRTWIATVKEACSMLPFKEES